MAVGVEVLWCWLKMLWPTFFKQFKVLSNNFLVPNMSERLLCLAWAGGRGGGGEGGEGLFVCLCFCFLLGFFFLFFFYFPPWEWPAGALLYYGERLEVFGHWCEWKGRQTVIVIVMCGDWNAKTGRWNGCFIKVDLTRWNRFSEILSWLGVWPFLYSDVIFLPHSEWFYPECSATVWVWLRGYLY